MGSPTKENKKSLLLTQEENDLIFSILKPKCQSLATTVVQMFSTSGRTGTEWNYYRTGVLCLIRDVSRRSYFFQLLCPEVGKLVWEHEVYTNLDYLQLRPYLYSFEAEDYIVGFNFACEDEASQLYSVLLEKLIHKRERMQRRTIRRVAATREVTEVQEEPVTRLVEPIKGKQRFTLRRKKKKRQSFVISSPRNFQHLSHLGWDQELGFTCTNVDPTVKEWLDQNEIPVTKDNVEDIYEFIERNGGLDRVKRELNKPPSSEEVPPPYSRERPGSPRGSRGRPVNIPPPPSYQAPLPPPMIPLPPRGNNIPPPPPPPSGNPLPVQPSVLHRDTQSPPPLPPPNLPLPPPLPSTNLPPPPPLPPTNLPPPPPSVDSPPPPVSSQPPLPPPADPRSNLLEDIRKGIKLKSVNTKTDSPKAGGEDRAKVSQGTEGKLADALKNALLLRSSAIQDNSDGSNSDSEWEE